MIAVNWHKLFMGGLVAGLTWTTGAATSIAPPTDARPGWLTEASLGVKESYDNNVFLSGVGAPPPSSVLPGSVAALKEKTSWVTTVSPKIEINFAPWLGTSKTVQVLSLAYAPDWVTYHDQNSESYNAQRFATVLKAKTDSVAVSADNSFVFVDGNQLAPVYPGALYSAFATTAVRERREQIQDRANFAVQFDSRDWFFRPCAALLYYDLLTDKTNAPGYLNFTDRYDVNGGADVGYKINLALAVTLGWRYGHQEEEQYSFATNSSPSDYQRVLLGLEGRPWQWLDLKLLGGPDFRDYAGNTATHVTPVNDLHPIKYYGEALVTAKFTPADALTFKYKQWQWLSSTGKVPYFDSTYDLSYHRKLTSQIGLDVGGRLLFWDYSSGNLATCRRKDLQYTATAGLGYAVNAHLSLTANCTFDWGRNEEDRIVSPENREFDHQLFSLGAQCKF